MNKKNAFSLSELSIVLLILSLLMLLVIYGKSAIEAANINATCSEISDIKSAIENFKTTYSYLPGDIPDASSKVKANLINGNGDGVINTNSPTGEAQSGYVDEMFLVWGHLRYANMLNITTPVLLTAGTQSSNNLLTLSSFTTAKYSLINTGNAIFTAIVNNPDLSGYAGLVLHFASCNTLSGNICIAGGINTKIMQSVDLKIDDGIPLEGYIFGLNDSQNKCNTVNGNGYVANSKYQYDTNLVCMGAYVLNSL